MDEKRRAKRWFTNGQNKGSVVCAGMKEDVNVVDVSTGGMKVACQRIPDIGSDVYGRLKLHPNIGPFYVQGKVLRVEQVDGIWNTAVEFNHISAYAFLESQVLSMLNA
jgi:hypothetical protein